MNRFYKNLGIVIIITVIGFSITACGDDSPKGLAKQVRQLDHKVDKLSAEDQKIMADEYKRLVKENK